MPISSVPAAPPRKSSSAAARTESAKPASPATIRRANDLAGWVQLAGIGCIMKGWHADAGAIAKHGDNLALEAARIGEQDERIGGLLDKLGAMGPYAGLMMAVVPFVTQIMVNHKILTVPAGVMGVVPKEALEAEVKAGIAQAQADAVIAQHEAEMQLHAAEQAMKEAGITDAG